MEPVNESVSESLSRYVMLAFLCALTGRDVACVVVAFLDDDGDVDVD